MNKKDFKLNVGYNIKDEKRDLVIIECVRLIKNKKGHTTKVYKYHCNKCGYEGNVTEDHLLNRKQGCSCCSGKTVVKGINDIATTNPEIIKYLKYIDDGFKYTKSSDAIIECVCPTCKYEKKIIVKNLRRQGFSCPICNDNIPIGEKIMLNLLRELDTNFIREYSKTNAKWCKNYRYDFYFKLDNEEYIIETHGIQHYEESFQFKNINRKQITLQEQQKNDKNKYELAIHNGIKPNNYIVIDCRESDFEYIKNSILHSELNNLFNLNNVDWIKIGQDSERSILLEICELWNNRKDFESINSISKKIPYCKDTIRKYIKIGKELNLCKYCRDEELELNKKRLINFNKNRKELKI